MSDTIASRGLENARKNLERILPSVERLTRDLCVMPPVDLKWIDDFQSLERSASFAGIANVLPEALAAENTVKKMLKAMEPASFAGIANVLPEALAAENTVKKMLKAMEPASFAGMADAMRGAVAADEAFRRMSEISTAGVDQLPRTVDIIGDALRYLPTDLDDPDISHGQNRSPVGHPNKASDEVHLGTTHKLVLVCIAVSSLIMTGKLDFDVGVSLMTLLAFLLQSLSEGGND